MNRLCANKTVLIDLMYGFEGIAVIQFLQRDYMAPELNPSFLFLINNREIS